MNRTNFKSDAAEEHQLLLKKIRGEIRVEFLVISENFMNAIREHPETTPFRLIPLSLTSDFGLC